MSKEKRKQEKQKKSRKGIARPCYRYETYVGFLHPLQKLITQAL